MFQDRREAGRELAQRLLMYRRENPVVVALPRGGVPVGYEIARLLRAPLDVRIVRKLGFPGQPELAIGAIVDGEKPEIVFNDEIDDTEFPPDHIDREVAAKLAEIKIMGNIFRHHRPAIELTDRTVIIVDDGIATGATMRVVIKRLRSELPAKIVVAVPVASREALALLRREADAVVCLLAPTVFNAVGAFYDDFRPVASEEVTQFLDACDPHHTSVGGKDLDYDHDR